jgi:signal transduction histidine kinase
MLFFPKFGEKFAPLLEKGLVIYPLLLLLGIPLLLVVNTYWSLRSFNRDINYILRHQATSIGEALTPVLNEKVKQEQNLDTVVAEIVDSNEDLLFASVLTKGDEGLVAISSYPSNFEVDANTQDTLSQFAITMGKPFAGLVYNPEIRENVWIVVSPVLKQPGGDYLLTVAVSTKSVDTILERTKRDSLIVLGIAIIATLILLTNYFVFYKKAVVAEKLRELDKLKDEFISMASHELKAPVTALTGYLELLHDKIPESALPSLENDLKTLNEITWNLNALINDLLEVSRIEQGRLKINKSKTNLTEVVDNVAGNFRPQIEKKGLKLNVELADLPEVDTDPDRLRQILTNLLSNSIKYTLSGEINILVKSDKKTVKLTIKDTGVGIPPEHMEKLFTKFHRVKDKKTQDAPGTGLGLWITKSLVEALGGNIYAESIYGSGTSISFTLPI